MNVWIQRHDFTSIDLGETTPENALAHFHSIDWFSEVESACERQHSGSDSCPAGIGFVHESGAILHLCPNGAGQMTIHFPYPRTRRFLGLFPVTHQSTRTVESASDAHADDLIRIHYSGDADALLEAARRIEQGDAGKPDHVPISAGNELGLGVIGLTGFFSWLTD